MISALHLDQMVERAERRDPDDMRDMAADIGYLAAEVRRLQNVVDSVQELVDRKLDAAHNYHVEASLGRVSRRYGFGMSNKLTSEARDLGRLLK